MKMSITIAYPQIVQFVDGTQLELTDDDWKKRLLVVETNRAEKEIREIFQKENFANSGAEFIKDGQLGSGLVRKFGDWQVHVRLFQHLDNIQLDAEAEVSSNYIEHLSHGWISAFKESWVIIEKHFGELWVYHKGSEKYVLRVIKEVTLELKEPESKTDVVTTIGIGVAAVLIGALIVVVLKK